MSLVVKVGDIISMTHLGEQQRKESQWQSSIFLLHKPSRWRLIKPLCLVVMRSHVSVLLQYQSGGPWGFFFTCGSVRSCVDTPGPQARLSTRWLCWPRPGRLSCVRLARWYAWSRPARSLDNNHRTVVDKKKRTYTVMLHFSLLKTTFVIVNINVREKWKPSSGRPL